MEGSEAAVTVRGRPGRDTVRFREVDLDRAAALARHVAHVLDDRHYERP